MDVRKSPAKQIEEFLNFVDACEKEYRAACEAVRQEDIRLQDLLHEMEFAANRDERNRVATRLQNSRKLRRGCKDEMKRDEQVVKFFEEQANRSVLKRLGQLLGRQRTEEQYLAGKRVYNPRLKETELQK